MLHQNDIERNILSGGNNMDISRKNAQISQKIIDDFLRTGGNRAQSTLRIIYNFMVQKTKEEYADFVKNEYGIGRKGFLYHGKPYTIGFDETGIQIVSGKTIHVRDKDCLSWESAAERIQYLLKKGEYVPQSVLDKARENAVKEHAEKLSYMIGDMADGLVECVFDKKDVPNLCCIYPKITDYLEVKLKDSQWLSDLNERLKVFVEAYKTNKNLMRFPLYNPIVMSKRLQEFTKDFVPFHAKEGFTWESPSIFITQDEIDSFLTGGERLMTYSFYLLNEDKNDRAEFLKRFYGSGGCSNALFGADHSNADYGAKGLTLSRKIFHSSEAKVRLTWKQAASRIDILIKEKRFLQKDDRKQLASYEKDHMIKEVLHFYNRLPDDIVRPFTRDLFWDKPREEILSLFSDKKETKKLLKMMDEAFASLPSDYKAYGTSYQHKEEILRNLHHYFDGSYTIFPEKSEEKNSKKANNSLKITKQEAIGYQMTIFDYIGIA